MGRAFVASSVALLAFAASIGAAKSARAGGFEIPDNGAEALGRGAAFTAKADDGTALEYNVAGLARQRGTRLFLGGNLTMNAYTFQRAGAFPDNPNDPHTPWGQAFYPQVTNQGGPTVAPFVALSSDLGFDRLTFAVGVFGPPSVGNRTYPLGVAGAPAASRYDVIQENGIIAYPTIAAAYRVTKELDLGVAFHAVYGSFNLMNASFIDLSSTLCPNPEYYRCDSVNHITASTWTYAASAGAMWRPDASLAFGLDVRTPYTLSADGTVTATPPLAAPAPTKPEPVHFQTSMPLELKAGVRYIAMEGTFERGDVEVDGTYEQWGTAQATGPTIDIPELSLFKDIHTTVAHHYNDTYGLRVGAAYNWRGLGGVVTLRGGGYFDSSATDPAYTRLDFDTLEKIAATAGLGYQNGALKINVGYAEIFSPDRLVTNGAVAPINGAQHGLSVDANGNPLPAVNNGEYWSHTRIVSASLEIRWDVFLGKARHVSYGNDYEDHGPPAIAAPSEPAAAAQPDAPDAPPPEQETEPEAHDHEAKNHAAPPPAAVKPAKKSDWDD